MARSTSMNERWFRRCTWQSPQWSVSERVSAKRGRTVSVVLPALNEEATVGSVVASVRPLVGGLVDELVVLDSGSSDGTAAEAERAGATVVRREEVLVDLAPLPGKGEA